MMAMPCGNVPEAIVTLIANGCPEVTTAPFLGEEITRAGAAALMAWGIDPKSISGAIQQTRQNRNTVLGVIEQTFLAMLAGSVRERPRDRDGAL
jgi:uncharacterized membrane protein